MAIQSAQAKLYSVFRLDCFALKVLSSDIFELGSSTGTSAVTFTLYPTKIMRLFPAMSMTTTMTTAGNIGYTYTSDSVGGLNKSSLRTSDTFYDNVELTTAQQNLGINLIGRTTLNLRTPTTITVDLSKVSFPVVPGQVYSIELTEDFFTEEFNNQMPSPAVALTTITAPSRPNIYGFSPFNGQSNYDDNTKIVLYADTEDVAGALTRGGGFFRLYKNGSLRTSINVLDSKVSISGNKITLNVLGLLDAGANYYVLVDVGVVSTLDGFPSLAVTSPTQIAFFTRESSDILFPDLVSLEVAAANLLVPQSEIMIYFASAMTSNFATSIDGERLRFITGTTDTLGGLTATVSALVDTGTIPRMTASSSLSVSGTFILANGRANLQSSMSLDFFVLMAPTTISAAFGVVKADISVRKPADFRLSATSSLSINGGYIERVSAIITATSSITCSTTPVAKALVLRYGNFITGSVLRLPLYGNVNVTVEWGGGQTDVIGYQLNGFFVEQGTPGASPYYASTGWGGGAGSGYGLGLGGGGFKQILQYTTPGVKTFTVPSSQSVTFNGQTGFTGANDFDGVVIIKGQLDYLGALDSQDPQSFESNLTGNTLNTTSSYLRAVESWGNIGLKGFRWLGRRNPEAYDSRIEYISPDFPNTLTDLTQSFAGSLYWNALPNIYLANNFPTNPTYPTNPTFSNQINYRYEKHKYDTAVVIQAKLPIKNVVQNMNTSSITKMEGTFKKGYLGYQQQASYNPTTQQTIYTVLYLDLAGWNTSSVTTMKEMFKDTSYFCPQGLNTWNTSLVTDFSYMFNNAVYDGNSANKTSPIDITLDIGSWNTTSATTMKAMFGSETTPSSLGGQNANALGATNALIPSLSGWNTANVTDMSFMFSDYRGAAAGSIIGGFYVPSVSLGVSGWNTANVTTMKSMFLSGFGWADDLSSWNTGKVTDFSFMFSVPTLVSGNPMNPNVSSWNTSSATNMMGMFMGVTRFNRPMTRSGNIWNTSKVTNMVYMLWSLGNGNELFNQDLSSWCVPLISAKPNGFDQSRTNTWTQARPIWGTCP